MRSWDFYPDEVTAAPHEWLLMRGPFESFATAHA